MGCLRRVLGLIVAGSVSVAGAATGDSEEVSERARRRQYVGGVDEEEIKVQEVLPRADRKTDARTLQKQVFKSLYNREAEDVGGPPDESVEE